MHNSTMHELGHIHRSIQLARRKIFINVPQDFFVILFFLLLFNILPAKQGTYSSHGHLLSNSNYLVLHSNMEKHGSRSIPKPSYMTKKHGAPQPARPKFKK